MERIICLVIGYVCGLFQTGYIIGKIHKTDIRDHGSGNAGTTNAFRTFGKKAGAITLLGDCLKCVLAIVIVRMVYGNSMNGILPLLTLYAALGCILGHNFPISMEFRGGKGIAASVGMIIAFDWRIFIVCAVVFFALFFTTHYVSLCSLSAYAVAFRPYGHTPIQHSALRSGRRESDRCAQRIAFRPALSLGLHEDFGCGGGTLAE